MTDKVQAFINAANSTFFDSRDIVVDKNNSVRLGNLIFSDKAENNENTMKAFRKALSEKYGVFGEHAFDTVLSSRSQRKKSLRSCDIKKTISSIDTLKSHRIINEYLRQLDTDPKFRELPKDLRAKVRKHLAKKALVGIDVSGIKTLGTLQIKVAQSIDKAIKLVVSDNRNRYNAASMGEVKADASVSDTDATGLKNLKVEMDGNETSVEDNIKSGKLGTGMTVNRSSTNPMILSKLKDNGVEPGFICHKDWSLNDTRSLMKDYESEDSQRILNELLDHNNDLREKCSNKDLTLRDKIMLCGNAHPACISAVADYMIEKGMKNPGSEIYKAFENKFPLIAPENYRQVESSLLKKELFLQIRNAVLDVKAGSDDYAKSPVFSRFTDRQIVKLDYNENDRVFTKSAAHAGRFMRPERITTRTFGSVYRIQNSKKADDISASAVTEALANDLSRIMGIPTQDLRIVRGKYSDGHPKIMLEAKFANGYEDLEKGYIKNGRIVVPPHKKGIKLEKLGKYKAFFLTTADRDGIGSHGQNKGFANGKFFAIDPGHSLEGNGKYLEIKDNLSFRDTYGVSVKPRFNNFTIFDDDTRFAKLQGVLSLRDAKRSGKIDKLFSDYRAAFNPDEEGISAAEKTLRNKIIADINAKEREFNESLQKILNVTYTQIKLYDDLREDGEETQKSAVETIENLEKLTSPTTWVSDDCSVPLDHLSVIEKTRIPWKARVEGDSLVYQCTKPVGDKAMVQLQAFASAAGVTLEILADGTAKITVGKDRRENFFTCFSEEKVKNSTHPDEAAARKFGGDGISEAKNYKSPLL